MRRARRPVAAGLCIALIALAGFLPGVSALHYALVELPWVLLPDQAVVLAPASAVRTDIQATPLVGLLPSRAPPARPAA